MFIQFTLIVNVMSVERVSVQSVSANSQIVLVFRRTSLTGDENRTETAV